MQTTTSWQDLLYPGDATDFFTRRQPLPFDPKANGYSADNALRLMELSRLVYRHDSEEGNPPPQPRHADYLGNGGFKQRRFFQYKSDGIDTQAMLVESTTQPAYAALAFRGTEQNSGDFKTDIKVWKDFAAVLKAANSPTNGNEAQVHQGFKEALDPVWNDIAAEIASLQCPVFYTGHSLGAALATLAAARHKPTAVYTFGSPRVGNQAFANLLAGIPIYRVVDDKDLVTTLPPEEILGKNTGFTHVGEEHRLAATQPSSILDWLKNLTAPPKPLADHAPVNYVDRISSVRLKVEQI